MYVHLFKYRDRTQTRKIIVYRAVDKIVTQQLQLKHCTVEYGKCSTISCENASKCAPFFVIPPLRV